MHFTNGFCMDSLHLATAMLSVPSQFLQSWTVCCDCPSIKKKKLVGQRVVGMLAKHPLRHVSDEAFRIRQGGKGVGKRPRRTAGGPTCLADGQGQVVMRKVPVQRNASACWAVKKLTPYTFLSNIFVAAFHPLDQPTSNLISTAKCIQMLYTILSWVFSGLTDAPVFFECFSWSTPKIEVQAAQCRDLVVQKVHLRTSQVGHGNPFGARAKKWIDVDGEVVQQRQDILVPQLLLAAAPGDISVLQTRKEKCSI